MKFIGKFFATYIGLLLIAEIGARFSVWNKGGDFIVLLFIFGIFAAAVAGIGSIKAPTDD